MTFTGMISILAAYFAAVLAAAYVWKPKPEPPIPPNRERQGKITFKEYHRSQIAKPIEREVAPPVFGQRQA
jgi:hypothetical protein